MTHSYFVEAWRRSECIAFATVARATTAERRASHFVIDKHADAIFVRRDHALVGQWQATGGWVIVRDDALRAAIESVDR